jgi:release factor glutamine methyltransferase
MEPRAGAIDVGGALGWAAHALAHLPAAESRREARILLGHATGLAPERLFAAPSRRLGSGERARFAGLVRRRAGREPIAHIIGEREFWSLPLAVTPETLVPRPDSEAVVEAALEGLDSRNRAARVLDLGTGSGCLLLALLSELPRACGIGTDISPGAVRLARANAERLGLAARAHFVVADWASGLAGRFDLVVCNPPYVASGEIDRLEPEVARFEPRHALDGVAVLEVGAGQAAAVETLLAAAGLLPAGRGCDLGGVERWVRARRG